MFDSSDQASLSDEITLFDPTAIEGYEERFNKEIPLNVQIGNGKPQFYVHRIRVLEKVADSDLLSLRVEIYTDDDITFFKECTVEPDDFDKLREQNHLRIEFNRFSDSIIELLENSVKKPKDYTTKLVLNPEDGSGTVTFLQVLRLRSVEVFHLEFEQSSEEFTQKQAQFRFRKLKIELQKKATELEQNYAFLEKKRPALTRQIQQSIARKLDQQK